MSAKKLVETKRVPVGKRSVSHPSAQTDAQAIPLILYRRIALLFVALVGAALLGVLYLATMQAVIRVTSVSKEVPSDFVVRTVAVAMSESEVQGEVHRGSIGRTKTVTVQTQDAREVPAAANGSVVITNAGSSAQPLIATTRLLTPEGVLFRLKSGVTVPARGTVEARVYADQNGATGNIGPSTFTIPGLSAAKQEYVTAQSLEPMAGGVIVVSTLSQVEIDQAVEVLQQELYEDAKAMLREQREGHYNGEAFLLEVGDAEVGAEAGEEVDTFSIKLNVSVTGVFYDEEALQKIARRKMYSALGQGQELIDLGEDMREITVQQVNISQKVAALHVRQTGRAIASHTSQALEPGRFSGMTEGQVRDVLVTEGVALDAQVEFFPFWVRRVPRLKDHIYVEIHQNSSQLDERAVSRYAYFIVMTGPPILERSGSGGA